MTTVEEKFDQDVWAVLQKIKEWQLYWGKKGERVMYIYSIRDWYDEKIVENLILNKLNEWGVIKNLEYDKSWNASFFDLVEPKFNELYASYQDQFIPSSKPTDLQKPTIKIKDAYLDQRNYLLEINKGEKVISFKSKVGGKDYLDKETKIFKILVQLWEFKWIIKDGKMEKGDFATLENLKRGSGCPTNDATYRHIKSLNNLFNKEGLLIKITGDNGKYRLIINKSS